MYELYIRRFLGANLARGFLALCALYCVQVGAVESVRAPGFDRFMALTTASGAQTINFSSGSAVLTDVHSTGSKVGNLGAFADSGGGKGLELRGSGKLGLPAGKSLPFTATAKISAAGIAKAGALAFSALGGWPGLAAIGAIGLLDWYQAAGIVEAPGGGLGEVDPSVCSVGPCFIWAVPAGIGGWSGYSPADACSKVPTASGPAWQNPEGQWYCPTPKQYGGTSWWLMYSAPIDPVPGGGVLPLTTAEAEAKLSAVPAYPNALSDLYNAAQSVDVENVVVSVPASVDGPITVTEVPAKDGQLAKTITTATVWDCLGVMETVSCTEKKTTTEQKAGVDPDTSLPWAPSVTTETTSEPKAPERVDDPCLTNPTRVGCAVLDVPDGDIPKKTVNVDFTPEDLGLGDGSCPAPIGFDVATGHYELNLASWCDAVTTWVRPLVVSIATLMAFMIAWPRSES